MRTRILILGLICLFIFAYCNSPADPDIEKALNPGNPNFIGLPIIEYITATPGEIAYGNFFMLAWSVSNASHYIIVDGDGVSKFESPSTDIPLLLGPQTLKLWPEESTNYYLTAKNNNGTTGKSCYINVIPPSGNVVMTAGPYTWTNGPRSYTYPVGGCVKNIGTGPALNIKISVECWGGNGNFLASGETTIDKLESQIQECGWLIVIADPDLILYYQMHNGSEIRYEITWDESL